MVPTQMTETLIYWACNDPKHRHRTRVAAGKCCAKQEHMKTVMPRYWGARGRAEIVALLRAGTSKSDLVRIFGFGLTEARVERIVSDFEYDERRQTQKVAAVSQSSTSRVERA